MIPLIPVFFFVGRVGWTASWSRMYESTYQRFALRLPRLLRSDLCFSVRVAEGSWPLPSRRKLFIYVWIRDGYYWLLRLTRRRGDSSWSLSFCGKPVGFGMIHGSLSNGFSTITTYTMRQIFDTQPEQTSSGLFSFFDWWAFSLSTPSATRILRFYLTFTVDHAFALGRAHTQRRHHRFGTFLSLVDSVP